MPAGSQPFHRAAVGDIDGQKLKSGRPRQARKPRLLQAHIIIVAQIIDADELVAAREKRLSDRGANEAGGAGDKNPHAGEFFALVTSYRIVRKIGCAAGRTVRRRV